MCMVSSVSVIFDTGYTYSYFSNKGDFVKLEEKKFPIKLKGISKGLEISGFGIVEYSVRDESGRIIVLQDQAYYFPGLPKDLHIIYPQGISTSEKHKSTLIANCHDENDGYVELNLKEENPGWKKAEPIERVNIKYDPKNNIPTHEAILPNQIEKEVKALASAVCVTNEANQKLTPLHQYLLRWNFRLGNIGFQHVQWLIHTGHLKVQGNSKAVANYYTPKCAACEFGKGHCKTNKVNTNNKNPMKEQDLNKDNILLGKMVSEDHYI